MSCGLPIHSGSRRADGAKRLRRYLSRRENPYKTTVCKIVRGLKRLTPSRRLLACTPGKSLSITRGSTLSATLVPTEPWLDVFSALFKGSWAIWSRQWQTRRAQRKMAMLLELTATRRASLRYENPRSSPSPGYPSLGPPSRPWKPTPLGCQVPPTVRPAVSVDSPERNRAEWGDAEKSQREGDQICDRAAALRGAAHPLHPMSIWMASRVTGLISRRAE